MERQTRSARRLRRRRHRIAAIGALAVLVLAGVVFVSCSGGSSTTSTTTTKPSSGTTKPGHSTGPPSIEAGVEPWQLQAPLSREAVVANGSGLTVLGGITPAGSSVTGVYTLDPATGAHTAAGTLPDAVHDGAGGALGSSTFVFGGGSPTTFATVQSIATPAIPPSGSPTGVVAGRLPQPRSDLAVTTVTVGKTTTAYLVGGYDGTTYLPGVLSTTDGSHYSSVANLPVPVRYPALAALKGNVYAFGGQTAAPGSATTATDAIQRIDPVTHRATVVGHLPQTLYGAAAFVIAGTIYVAGGQIPAGPTLTQIYAYVPSTGKVLDAGLLPQAVAFGGFATVGSGTSAIGYIVGGEVAAQSGNDQAGVPSGSLQTVLSLRPSSYGGPAGGSAAGAPFSGKLLVADRGNDRLLVMDPARNLQWQYPSATMPAPPGGFYFPDDAFFFDHGKGIISNQEDNHTIVEIGYPSGAILWQYGHPGQSGSAPGYLNQPDDAFLLKNGTITVADASNNRILFLSQQKQVTGQIGNGADAHVPGTSVAYPNGDTPLADGNVLVSEIHGSWIDEYTPSGHPVWSVQFPTVNYPSDPQQLGPDLYLMTDYNPPAEGRVLEFDREGKISWSYDVAAGDSMLKKPSLAERLPNGLILVNDDYRDRLVAIDPAINSIVWQYGLTDKAGTAPGLISIPDGFDLLLANGTTPTHLQTG